MKCITDYFKGPLYIPSRSLGLELKFIKKWTDLTHLVVLFSFQLSRRLGNVFYNMMNLPLPVSGLQPPPEKNGDRSSDISSPLNCNSVELLNSPRDTEALKSTEPVSEADNPSPSQMSETTWKSMQNCWTFFTSESLTVLTPNA